jgi:Glycosyl transferase family 2
MTPLPLCRWRREQTAPDRHACVSPKLVTGPRGVPDSQCDTCYCRDHPAPKRPRDLCSHLGQRVEVRDCPPCSARARSPVTVPVHNCSVHAKCTIALELAGLECCASCHQYWPAGQLESAGAVRHLMYFIYPFGPVWRWNVSELKRRLSLFNGRRIVSVATSSLTATFEEVKSEFKDLDCTLIELSNDPELKEMAAYPRMVEMLEPYHAAGDVAFYAHAKGVTSQGWAPGSRPWTEAMYAALLDYWPEVRRQLADFPAVGIFQRLRTGLPGSTVTWHFSGSFRWVRNRDLYSRNWRAMDHNWCGSEGHLAKHFAAAECACLFGQFGQGGLGLYLEQTWKDWAQAARETWEADHVADRRSPAIATVILTAHAQPERVHEAIESVRSQTIDSWQLLIVDSGRIAATGAYDRYALDGRVEVILTGETAELRGRVAIQAWAINEAWRRGRVRGDLVMHLCDDDVLYPDALAVFLEAMASNPGQAAWYRSAERLKIESDGNTTFIDILPAVGVARLKKDLDCKVDGMQVAHRRNLRTDWPENPNTAWHADGLWMGALAEKSPVHPLLGVLGAHRLTPTSTFTKAMP